MTLIFKPETVGEFITLRGNLAATYLSAIGVLRTLEAEAEVTTPPRRERLRAELDAVDIVPITNPADQRW
ncbi:hypothetical protein [Nocardiopsis lambiniae]|uniref:Uncharacterized protein n=1 Tax=Nocardiopsis lambiniae TaxID=3075539 RepID=A0ABU2MDY5_9ACTN|nr:hypothetical protein [Nocardiopsis sp. DSM 44743]MDT0330888.1 hypothetical protein [Nocardiopsis sp. DSM 44743]